MSISVRELAEKIGVSATTVSHVLNRTGSARVARVTQERVWRAAEEMGYKPNPLARSLGRRKTDTIGLLISGLKNPFFVSVLERAEELFFAFLERRLAGGNELPPQRIILPTPLIVGATTQFVKSYSSKMAAMMSLSKWNYSSP